MSAAQIAAVNQNHGDAYQHAHLTLRPGVKQPAVRTEQARRIGNAAVVQEGTKFHGEYPIAVNILVHLPIGEEVAAAEGRGPLAPAGGARVAAQPQVIVALDAELEKLVEWHGAQRGAGANTRAHLEVVAAGAWQPMCVQGAASLAKGSELLRERPANA